MVGFYGIPIVYDLVLVTKTKKFSSQNSQKSSQNSQLSFWKVAVSVTPTWTERHSCRSGAPPVAVLESCRSGALPVNKVLEVNKLLEVTEVLEVTELPEVTKVL